MLITFQLVQLDARGLIIAEGDVLALCIRLFSELLLDRYRLPLPAWGDSSLSHLAHSILGEYSRGISFFSGGHRDSEAEYFLLPQAEAAIRAIGHAMAYAAARDSGHVPASLLAIYEAGVVRDYSAWFSEVAGVSVVQQRQRETDALRGALADLPQFAQALGVQEYVRASIVDDATWKKTVQQMVAYTGPNSDHPTVVSSTAPAQQTSLRARL